MVVQIENSFKLITREDPYHIHKSVGTIALAHYIYRFYNFSFINEPLWLVWSFVFIHAFLSGSSLIFHIPSKRIPLRPMIYPEFRVHSIIFTYRSIIAMAFILLNYSTPLTRSLIIMLTLIAADITTGYYAYISKNEDQSSTLTKTMRGMPFSSKITAERQYYINLYYSISQVYATLVVLYSSNLPSVFILMFPIQMAALLMTLARKSIISCGDWHTFYALTLLSNYYYISQFGKIDGSIVYFTFSSLFFCVGRFGFKLNKYLLWSIIAGMYIYSCNK